MIDRQIESLPNVDRDRAGVGLQFHHLGKGLVPHGWGKARLWGTEPPSPPQSPVFPWRIFFSNISYVLLRASQAGTSGKEPTCQCRRCETQVRSLDREDPLEEVMATHFRILAWRIPWTEEPGGLQSTGSQESDRTEATQYTLMFISDTLISHYTCLASCLFYLDCVMSKNIASH